MECTIFNPHHKTGYVVKELSLAASIELYLTVRLDAIMGTINL